MTLRKGLSSLTERTSRRCGWQIFGARWQFCSRTIHSSPLRQVYFPIFCTRARQYVCSQIRENIALGDPTRAHDDAAVEQAANLGCASEVISRLPEGFDTYLERPVRDEYSGLPDGTTTLFGRKTDSCYLRGIVDSPTDNVLSGGEMQRVAVARTFMRSSSVEQRVGLLLFDEPSASLDTTAEHGMHFAYLSPFNH